MKNVSTAAPDCFIKWTLTSESALSKCRHHSFARGRSPGQGTDQRPARSCPACSAARTCCSCTCSKVVSPCRCRLWTGASSLPPSALQSNKPPNLSYSQWRKMWNAWQQQYPFSPKHRVQYRDGCNGGAIAILTDGIGMAEVPWYNSIEVLKHAELQFKIVHLHLVVLDKHSLFDHLSRNRLLNWVFKANRQTVLLCTKRKAPK